MTVAEREQDPERTPAVDLRLMEAEPDGLEFKLSRATSRAGVPMTLMVGPRDAPKGKRWDEPTRNKTWRPPVSSGQLCPVGRAYADQMPGGDDLLAWYRSHGRERQHEVMHRLLRWAQCSDWERFAGPLQAATVLSWAMERVRSGRRRIRPTRPTHGRDAIRTPAVGGERVATVADHGCGVSLLADATGACGRNTRI